MQLRKIRKYLYISIQAHHVLQATPIKPSNDHEQDRGIPFFADRPDYKNGVSCGNNRKAIRRHLPVKILICFFLLYAPCCIAQDISFFHLNTAKGLSDNRVNVAVRDRNGLLWVGTSNGLNCFDGYSVKCFFKEQYPELGSNNISSIICDTGNRLWIYTADNTACMVDEKRTFHTISILENGAPVKSCYMVKLPPNGIMYKNGAKFYTLKDSAGLVFERMHWQEDTALAKSFIKWSVWNNRELAFMGDDRLCIFDTEKCKVSLNLTVPGIAGAQRINDTTALITSESSSPLFKINLLHNTLLRDYSNLTDQYGEKVNSSLRGINSLSEGVFLLTSGYAGVYFFDEPAQKLVRYKHDPVNDRSPSANNTFYAYADTSGFFFITTTTAGLNYFNVRNPIAAYQPSFKDDKTNNIFDGYISAITAAPDGNIWLGTQSRLIEWDRNNHTTFFHDYGEVQGVKLDGNENIRALFFDARGYAWIGTSRFGAVVLNKNRQPVKYLPGGEDGPLPSAFINAIVASPDNKEIWISTNRGIAVIDPANYSVKKQHTAFLEQHLKNIFCGSIWFRSNNEVWIGTTQGAWRYRPAENRLDSFTILNGIAHNTVTGFAEDNFGNVYVGTNDGLNRIDKQGNITIFKKGAGLRNAKCESLVQDNAGNIWIANGDCILKYQPAKTSFDMYDESSGLSSSGFRDQAVLFTADGLLVYGCNRGISFFKAADITHPQIPLQVMISSFTAGTKDLYNAKPQQVTVDYADNTLLFTFSAIDLYSSRNIHYKYKLEGADEAWSYTNTPQQVIYNRLAGGTYTFKVMVSRNGTDWISALNIINVRIESPWWRSAWFTTLVIVCCAVLITIAFLWRHKKLNAQKEALEIEKSINWFATSLNEKNSTEDILWDVTQNCIRHLNFEDCVIYLTDNDRQVLVQKAAWGPKTTDKNKIINPIEIPFGAGITGSVAQSATAEIVNDTSADSRYIIDDTRRFSEICVPIIAGKKVLGVIDSEHSRKNFFTQKHLSILSTIASLCAVKILRTITEKEKQQAQEELRYMQQRAVETEMLALRAQMNPHFMFNSLNSINNFILKNDTEKASEYLTRFSQLMRMILDNSRQEWVLLENELKALQLYLELESVRLKNVFDYSLVVQEHVNIAALQIPPMLIQPYVENAIWHGLLHRKQAGGLLHIHISHSEQTLKIIIEDNGIGRKKSIQLKSKYLSHKKSYGMKITAERMEIINKIYPVHISVTIDNVAEDEGTLVVLLIKKTTAPAEANTLLAEEQA